MESTMEDRIRQHAYFLWLDNNKMGDATYFWLVAEREVRAKIEKDAAAALVEAAPVEAAPVEAAPVEAAPVETVAAPQSAPTPAAAATTPAQRRAARRVNALVLLDTEAESAAPALGVAAE